MKYYFIIGLLSFSLMVQAQKKNNGSYKTKIDRAGLVEIKGGTTTILKADTVIINQSVRTKIYYSGSTTTRDTSGNYMTSYRFYPEDNPGSFPVDITIWFNKPYIPLTRNEAFYVDGDAGGGITTLQIMPNPDFTALKVRGQVIGDCAIIHVKSKEPLFATIFGVDGRH